MSQVLAGIGSGLLPATKLTDVIVTSNTTSSTSSISYPSDVKSGDVAVLFDGATGGSYSSSALAGFTPVDTAGGSVSRENLQYRLCDGTEGGTSISCINGGTNAKRLLIIRGNIPIKTITSTNGQHSNNGSANPAALTLTIVALDKPSVSLAAIVANGSALTLSMSPTALVSGAVNGITISGYKTWGQSDSPANQTVTSTASGTGRSLVVGHLVFS